MSQGRAITFTRPDGQTAPGVYFSAPASPAPGVVLIQEWWGVGEQIRGVGRRLAEAGHRVVVPDLYRGRLATTPDEARHLMNGLDFANALRDLAGALAHLRAHEPDARVGVMGFCMGGALTLAALAQVPDFAAGVCFYGVPPGFDAAALRAPVQAHFGGHDDWCTPALVNALEGQLRRAPVEFELYRYPDAHHGFFNEARPEVHDPAAADLAWGRTLDFFGRHLRA